MSIYVCLLIVLILSLFLARYNKSVGILITVVLFSILVFRGENVGTDTLAYMNHYNYMYEQDTYSFSNFEFAYRYLIYLLRFLDLGPRSVPISLAIITFLFSFLSIRKLQLNTAFFFIFFVLTGYYFFSFNGSRQIAAISILLYAYALLIKNEDKLKVLVFIILAALIHKSIFFFIPIIFLPSKILNDSLVLIIVIISICFFWIGSDFLEKLTPYLSSDIYSNYKDVFDNSNSTSFLGKLYYTLILIIQLFIYNKSKEYFNPRLVNLFLISIIFFILVKNAHPILVRITYNITIIQVVYYALFFYNYKCTSTNNRLIYLLCLGALVTLLTYQEFKVLTMNIGEIVPYSTLF